MESAVQINADLLETPGYDPGPHWQTRYWLVFVGQALSLIGSALTQFVLLWWITDVTGSITVLATAGLFALLPHALLAPLGGVWADRYSRRWLMVSADGVSALCMGVLVYLFQSDQIQLWHVYAMMFIRSAMQAIQSPAAAASTAMLVPASFLPRAAGLNQTALGLMVVAAAPLGALAISLLPMGWALSIDVLTAVMGIVPLLIFSIPQRYQPSGNRVGVIGEFAAGCRCIWDHAGLLRLYLVLGGVTVVVMPTFTLVPLLIKEHFGGGAPEVALLEGLAGVGMLAGGALLTVLAPRHHMTWVIWGFAISCLAMSLTALAPAQWFWLAVICWSISGAAFIMGNGPLTALLQTIIPNELQGRVLSLMGMIMGLSAPIGLGLAIPLGELLGVRWLFVVLGAIGTLISFSGLMSSQLKRLSVSATITGPPGQRYEQASSAPPR